MIDVVFIILIIFGCLKGMKKGVLGALFSTIGFSVGIIVGLKFSSTIANRIGPSTSMYTPWTPFLSFLLLFTAVVLSMHYLRKIFEKTTELLLLGWLNKMGGIFLFIFMYSVIFSVLLFYLNELHLIDQKTKESSHFYSYLSPLAPDVINNVGKIIPFFKDLFNQLGNYFNTVPNKI